MRRGRPCYGAAMTAGQHALALKSNPVFGGLPEREIEALAASSREVECRPHDYVFMEGDPAEWLCIVKSGRVRIVRHSKAGKDVRLWPRPPANPIITTLGTVMATTHQILDKARELCDAERFGEKDTGARVESRLTRFTRREGGDGDHGRGQVELLSRSDDVEPVAVREPQAGADPLPQCGA